MRREANVLATQIMRAAKIQSHQIQLVILTPPPTKLFDSDSLFSRTIAAKCVFVFVTYKATQRGSGRLTDREDESGWAGSRWMLWVCGLSDNLSVILQSLLSNPSPAAQH